MINTNNSKIGSPFPFRIFCQKVIPLAFDESMSYLELLYSLLHYLKETVIPAVNNNADAVTELQNLYNELKSYVDNYFENLDVQEEINNKLDEMATDGTLDNIINNEIFTELNNKIDLANSQIETLINSYGDIFTNPLNKFVMVGDSIAEGYGWWGGNPNNKNNQNDGLMALLRNDYPNTQFTNLSVSGSTIANIVGHPNLQTQIQQIPNNTTHCFIMTSINDVTITINDHNNYIGYPKDKVLSVNYINNDYTTTCNAFESNIQELLQKNNNMKIYFIIEPTIDNDNYYLYNMCFSFLKFICDKYGVNVVDFRQMFRKYYEPYSSQFFYDKVHINQSGYNFIYPYFRNHIRYDINDNFAELPPCLISNVNFNFENNIDDVNGKMYDIAEEISEKAPLWQQNFETLLLNINDLGATNNKSALLKFTFNFVWCKLDIMSIMETKRYNYSFYIFTNKKYGGENDNNTTIIKPNYNYQSFSSDITTDMNITDISQLKWVGLYKIDWNKLEQITNLHTDLKSSNNGWAFCEVLSYDTYYMVQRWTSLMLKNYIYMAYITISNNNVVVEWKKIPLQND